VLKRSAHWSRAAVQMHHGPEQFLASQRHIVRNTDEANVPAGPAGTDCLMHGFLHADAFQHAISPDAFREFLDGGDTFIAA
jgi:hypothetical protein